MLAYSPVCPNCPSCGTVMHLGRRIPALGHQPELQNFECRPCGIVVTEAAPRTARPKLTVPFEL